MRYALLLPLAMLGLAGCVDVHDRPAQPSATVVTPAPTATYVAPAAPSSTTVIRTP